jgi:hypothetical protein
MPGRCAISTLLGTALFGAFFLAGCSRPKSYAPETDTDAAGKAAIEQYDADRDGKISGAELDKAASLKSTMKLIDADGDKALTAEEIANRIRSWQKSPTLRTRTPIHCIVYRNKEILPDAEVKFMPEKFMGDKIPVAHGKTNAAGSAVLVVDNSQPDDPPGVGPGFYRVEITKEGEEIPAKFNAETIFGVDTTMDNPAVGRGFRFDLDYKLPKTTRK